MSGKGNIEVVVLAPSMPGDREFDSRNNFKTIRVTLPEVALFSIPFYFVHLFSVVKNENPDLIINMLWMPSGIVSCLTGFFTRVPYVLMAHGVEILESTTTFRKKLRSFLSPLKRLVFRRARHVFAVSHFTAAQVEKFCRIPAEKIKVVYNGVNPQDFHPVEFDPELRKSHEGKKIFLTITRMVPNKGVDTALKALSRIKEDNFHYMVGGDGPYLGKIKQMVSDYKLEDKVTLLGRIEGDRLREYYSMADCFVLLSRFEKDTPSVEGFGLVFLEAAACKTPSIAGKSGGTSDAVIHNKTGFLVEPENVIAVADLFTRVLNEVDLEQNGEQAYERAVTEMTWDKFASRIISHLS